MKYCLSLFLAIFLIFDAFPVSGNTDNNCSYCGDWIPFYKVPYLPHLPGEHLSITESSISLPGCAKVNIEHLLSANQITEKTENDKNLGLRLMDMVTVLRTKDIAYCEKPIPDIPSESIIEIAVDPRIQGNEKMTVSLFSTPVVLDELKKTYICESKPDGKTWSCHGDLRPKEILSWSLIRKGHNPGEEGGNSGAIIASHVGLYEADGLLNLEWRRLISILPELQRSKVISNQNKWLNLLNVKCDHHKINEQNNDQWNSWHETNCREAAYSARTGQFKAAFECVSKGKKHCIDLQAFP